MTKRNKDTRYIYVIEIRCHKCKKISYNRHELPYSMEHYKYKTPNLKACGLCNNRFYNRLISHIKIGKIITEVFRY